MMRILKLALILFFPRVAHSYEFNLRGSNSGVTPPYHQHILPANPSKKSTTTNSLSYMKQLRLPAHPDAVFMSACAIPDSDHLAVFYRERYDMYSTCMAILNGTMDVVLDAGPRFAQVEDPRAILFRDDIYVIDNHMAIPRKIYQLSSGKSVVIRHDHPSQGKNWSPFEFNGQLHFVFSFFPLCVLRCNVSDGRCSDIMSGCIGSTHSGEYRGGTNALVRYERVFGVGHRTLDGNTHVPFLWSFPVALLDGDMSRINAHDVVVLHDFSSSFEHRGIHDPSALVQVREKYYVFMTESARSWFEPQYYNLTIYQLEIPHVQVSTPERP